MCVLELDCGYVVGGAWGLSGGVDLCVLLELFYCDWWMCVSCAFVVVTVFAVLIL